ncbi:MAG: hypothetical protein ACI81R_001583 [Bradymonadia bacterium]|jgi:hypothetical protein
MRWAEFALYSPEMSETPSAEPASPSRAARHQTGESHRPPSPIGSTSPALLATASGSLRALLSDFQRRAGRRSLRDALTIGVAAWLCVMAIALTLATIGGPLSPLRVMLWVVSPALIVGAVLLFVLGARNRFAELDQVAGYFEACDPSLRSDVRTALDFGSRPGAVEPQTDALREHLITRVSEELGRRRDAILAWVPARSTKKPMWAASAAVTVSCALLLLAPQSAGPAARALLYGEAPAVEVPRSARPLVHSVDVGIRPPAYTGRTREERILTTGDIVGLAGSEISLRIRLLRRAETATVIVSAGGEDVRHAAPLETGDVAVVTFPLTGNGRWEIELTDAQGETERDPIARHIVSVPDTVPDIELLTPTEDREVTPDEVVNLEYLANDDFGLADVSVVWAFAGAEDDTRSFALQTQLARASHQEHVPFELAPLLLMPRDEVLVWIEATDNNALSGPGVGTSRVVRFRIASPEDRSAEILAMKEALFEALLTQLGGYLEAPLQRWMLPGAFAAGEAPPGTELAWQPTDLTSAQRDEHARSARGTHDDWEPILRGWEALNVMLTTDANTPEADRDAIVGAYALLEDAVRDEAAYLDRLGVLPRPDGVSQSAFARAATANEAVVGQTERTSLMLEDLIALHKADDVQRSLDELQEMRERLTDLLEQYRESNDPALRDQIERELRRIEARMRELLERLASQASELPREHLNAEAIDPSEVAEDVQQMTGALDEVRAMLDQGNIDGALEAMQSLDDALASLQQEMGAPLDGASPDGVDEFDQRMGELMDQLNDVEAAESEILGETQRLVDQMRERRAQEIAPQVDRRLDELRARVAAVAGTHRKLGRSNMSESAGQALNDIDVALEQLEARLAESDVAAAEDVTTRLLSQLSDALFDLRSEEALRRRGTEGHREAAIAGDESRESRREIEAIQDELQRLQALAVPRPNAQESSELAELSQQQSTVEQMVEDLSEGAEQLAMEFPQAAGQLDEPLQQVQQAMQQARQALQGDPQPGDTPASPSEQAQGPQPGQDGQPGDRQGAQTPGQQPGQQPGGQTPGQQPGGQTPGQQPGGQTPGQQPGGQTPGQQPGGQTPGQQPGQGAPPRPRSGQAPRQALQGEQSALQGLQTLRQRMQQMTMQQRQRQSRQEGRNNTERVEVPEEGESSRRGYRDQVIEAMRDGSLEAYDEQIREYYETLLR